MTQSHRTDIYVSWDEIQSLCTELSATLLNRGLRRDRMLAITRGGLFPAGLIARELDIRQIDTIGVIAYDDQTVGEPRLVKAAAPEFLENCLIVDDLVDTGATLDFIRGRTRNCTFATVFAKPQGAPKVDLYAREVPQDTWIRFPWDTRRQFAEPLIKGKL